MMLSPARSFPAICCTLVLTSAALAAEPAIIAKARAFLGSEAALTSVTSIHFEGSLTTEDPADPTKQTSAPLDIIFQKPERQRIQATGPRLVEITAIDGFDGWKRLQETADPSKWQQDYFKPDDIRRLLANTIESLHFFRVPEAYRVKVEERGSASFDGIDCVRVAFIHAPGVVFTRYFDKATGRLVLTETEGGGTIQENGELRANGVRFPKTIVNKTKEANGQVRKVTITFEKITLNEKFPASLFAPPPLLSK